MPVKTKKKMELENVILKPMYKDVTFKSDKKFKQWIEFLTVYEIDFSDPDIDLQKMHLAKSGEILHCDYHGSIYNGKFVNIKNLDIAKPIQIQDETGEWISYNRLLPEKISWSVNKQK